jgi:hypothetical protein
MQLLILSMEYSKDATLDRDQPRLYMCSGEQYPLDFSRNHAIFNISRSLPDLGKMMNQISGPCSE